MARCFFRFVTENNTAERHSKVFCYNTDAKWSTGYTGRLHTIYTICSVHMQQVGASVGVGVDSHLQGLFALVHGFGP